MGLWGFSRGSAAGVFVAVFIITGSANAAGGPLTRAQYDRQATNICRTAMHSLPAGLTSGSPPKSVQAGLAQMNSPKKLSAALAPLLKAAFTATSTELRSLRELTPPPALAPAVKRGLQFRAETVSFFRSLSADAAKGQLSFQEFLGRLFLLSADDSADTATWKTIGAPLCA